MPVVARKKGIAFIIQLSGRTLCTVAHESGTEELRHVLSLYDPAYLGTTATNTTDRNFASLVQSLSLYLAGDRASFPPVLRLR